MSLIKEQGRTVMQKFGPRYFIEILLTRPIFNQELKGQSFRYKKRLLGDHIGGQRSIWSKIGGRRKAPFWNSGNAPTSNS